jgi:hypothetical protein
MCATRSIVAVCEKPLREKLPRGSGCPSLQNRKPQLDFFCNVKRVKSARSAELLEWRGKSR